MNNKKSDSLTKCIEDTKPKIIKNKKIINEKEKEQIEVNSMYKNKKKTAEKSKKKSK